MALVEMVMPKMGEGIMEGTILTWLKNVGDEVSEDESVVEVATDKVDTEIPTQYTGILNNILVKVGDVVQVGSPIAIIETDQEIIEPTAEESSMLASLEEAEATVNEAIDNYSSKAGRKSTPFIDKKASDKFYSPLVLNIARNEGLTAQELTGIEGTGQDGRVTKYDIKAYLQEKKQTRHAQQRVSVLSKPQNKAKTFAPPVVQEGDEIVEMNRMRKMIAERMLESKEVSAHVTSFVEADVSEVVAWRSKHKRMYMDEWGQVLTFTPIFIHAIARAIKNFPMINVQIDGDKIIKKKDINIGMAVALSNGNLIVPVIRNADQLSIKELTVKVNDFAKRARSNSLKAEDLRDGTYTMSNVGSFGNMMGTPILMQPQVGILALGAIVKKPSVVEMDEGDIIAIRHKMFLSHSYDHRVIDGALGGMFVRKVADYLEGFDGG